MPQAKETTWDPTIVSKFSRPKRVTQRFPFDDVSSRYCKPNRFYCGYELALRGYTKTEPNRLYRCDNDSDGQYYARCNTCVGNIGSDVQSSCACRKAVLCGYELRFRNMVFPGLQDHTLYKCVNHAHVDRISKCLHKCKCTNGGVSSCDNSPPTLCTPGALYCGYQLAAFKLMGWQPHHLYECLTDGSGKFVQSCFGGCSTCEGGGNSYCENGRKARPRVREVRSVCASAALTIDHRAFDSDSAYS